MGLISDVLGGAAEAFGADAWVNAVSAVAEGDWDTAFKEIGSLAVQYAVTAYTGNPQMGEMAAEAFETTVNGGDFGEITQASIASAVKSTVAQFAGPQAAQVAADAFNAGANAALNGSDYDQVMQDAINSSLDSTKNEVQDSILSQI